MKIVLLGDPAHSIDDVATILEHAGIEIEINCFPFDGAKVVVFVSCLQGISTATLDVLEQWNGKTVFIPAAILTETRPDLDTDIVELVFTETQWVLFNNHNPGIDDITDKICCLRSDDIFIADKLKDIISTSPPHIIFHCNRQEYEQYCSGFE